MSPNLPEKAVEDGRAEVRLPSHARSIGKSRLFDRAAQRFMHRARCRDDQVPVVVADRSRAAVLAPDFRADGLADHGDQRFGAFGLGGGLFFLACAAAAAEHASTATAATAAAPTAISATPAA